MNVCFLFDETAWGLPAARYAVDVLRRLLEVPSRLAPTGSALGRDEAVVLVGETRQPGVEAAAIIPVLPWGHWTPRDVRTVSFEGQPLLVCGPPDPAPGGENALPRGWLRAVAFAVCREEELAESHRDEWDCFNGFSSRLHELGVLHLPLVNLWAAQLARRISAWCERRMVRAPVVQRWKSGAPFAVVLSHDVDWTRRFSLAEGLRLLRQSSGPRSYAFRRGLTVLLETLGRGVPGQDPFWTFERWMDEEAAHGFRSTFYFCAPRPARRHPYDPTYHLSDPLRFRGSRITVGALLGELAAQGFEVGLHGSYLSHLSGPELQEQRRQIEDVLGSPVSGLRQHFLRFDVRETWAAQEAAGFAYDSTLGYNEALGFRASIASPFHPWDAATQSARRILELPLTAMDGTLFRTLKLSPELAARRMREHLEDVEACGGLAVVLWHPNATDAERFPGWWDCYRETLAHVKARSAWVTTGREIASWWLERETRLEAAC
jgi:peptidoglycan/xylan/chitin deacetylase (PgdA/CDA1 family)